jgi:hypothetical protein
MILNINLINNMNKDQNLIFEAYTKSLINENTHYENEEYDNDALMVNGKW